MATYLPTTWAEFKTIAEGALSPGDRIVCLKPMTVTGTVTPTVNGSQALPITVDFGTWWHPNTITGGVDMSTFQFTNRSYWIVRDGIQTGGANFAKFSGNCTGLEILHIKGSGWTHTDSTMAQFFEAGGGTRNGCRIAFCEGFNADYDFFSTAGSWGWMCEFNYVHDLGANVSATSGLVDAFAMHDSRDGYSTFRFNRVENVRGKAAFSIASDTNDINSGSKAYVYCNVVSGCRYGILGGGDAAEVDAWCNFVTVPQILDEMGNAIGENNTFGIGSLTLDLAGTGHFYSWNNCVVNHGGDASIVAYAYRFSSEFQMVNCVSYCTGVESYFYFISQGASLDPDNVLRNNCHWSTTGDQARIRLGLTYDITVAQIQGLGGEAGSMNVNPEIRDATGTARIDCAPDIDSPLLGAGFDLSAAFTSDIANLPFVDWHIGPWARHVPDQSPAPLVIQVQPDRITCRI